MNARMRIGFTPAAGIGNYEMVLGLLQKIRTEYPGLGIKLGTVVAQQNIDSIAGIPALLARRGVIPDTWKLYQIAPSEYGKINYATLQVSDEQFRRVYEEAEANAHVVGIPNIIGNTNEERPGKYLFINPLGEALIVDPQSNDYRSIGNMLTSFAIVAHTWQDYVRVDRLTKNFKTTYPVRNSRVRSAAP